MSIDSPQPETDLLIQKYLSGSISEQEAEILLKELRRRTPDDLEFWNVLSDNIWVHNLLGHYYQTEKKEFPEEVLTLAGEIKPDLNFLDRMALEAAEAEEAAENIEKPLYAQKHAGKLDQGKTRQQTSKKNSPFYPAFLVSVVLFLIAIGIWSEFRQFSPENQPGSVDFHPVAQVTATVGIKGSDPASVAKTGQQFEAIRVHFEKGIMQFRLKNGVRLALEAPVDMRLDRADKIVLQSGKASVFVPPEAKGFTVSTPFMDLVDHGTEFSISVDDRQAETHTITGLTEALRSNQESIELPEGRAVRIAESIPPEFFPANSSTFLTEKEVERQVAAEETENLLAWKRTTAKWNEDPSLLVHFDFEGFTRTVPNVAFHGRPIVGDGRVFGTRSDQGRIHGKNALTFRNKKDSIRLDIPRKFRNMTLFASIKIDSLNPYANCLLASEDFGPGNLYWQLTGDGVLVLAIQPQDGRTIKFASPPVLPRTSWGAWYQLATVVDAESKTVIHYLDGREMARLPMENISEIKIGSATLGNGLWKSGAVADRSFRGSFDDFMIFDRPLSEQEIQSFLY